VTLPPQLHARASGRSRHGFSGERVRQANKASGILAGSAVTGTVMTPRKSGGLARSANGTAQKNGWLQKQDAA